MTTHPMKPIDDRVSELGEGPVWDVRSATLRWVDIPGGRVHCSDGSTEELPPPVTAVLPTATGWATVRQDRVVQGDRAVAVPLGAADRCNDAKTDPAGRIWVGTMSRGELTRRASLFRLDADGVTEVVSGASISNGLGWSPDGRRMYWADTPTGRIDVFDFDPADGSVRDRRPFAATELPDGLTVDAEGGVWVARWGSGLLHRYAPDGTLDTVLPVGVPHPTSCAFGGPDLRTLYVTTARRPGADGQFARHAGQLHAIRLAVPGLPATPALFPPDAT
ncbi:SMP-30/gluconolactonase/LRE family protein [Kitasatospora sp. NPDC002040]|uniref:SMP-30/gluconolactonase/LRE family protein n=1 Tax=Kitasatospora sp. NPDC002040 TaxID=3154661 RepID=UPI00332B0EA1